MLTSLFKPRDAYRVYLTMEGASSLFFSLIVTVNLIYQATVVDLDPLQLVLVGTVLETVVFVFEIPTGIVADVYSRRLSIIIGKVLIGAGFMLEGAIPRFEAVLAAQVLWGLGATFTSGATQAWIADEVGEQRAGHAFVRGAQIGQLGGLIGVGASVALGSVDIQAPIVLGGFLYVVVGIVLAFVMPEHGFTPVPPEERESWRTLLHTLRDGVRLVRGRSLLVIYLGVMVFMGLYSEGFDRLWTAHFLDNFTFPALAGLTPVIWFGMFRAAAMLLAVVGTEAVRRRVDVNHNRAVLRALLVINGVLVLSMVSFALASAFVWAVLAYLLTQPLRSVSAPLLDAWINPQITSDVRATVFSLAAQLEAVGEIAGGPGVGLIGRDISLRAALITSAALLSPVLGLFGSALKRARGIRVIAPADQVA